MPYYFRVLIAIDQLASVIFLGNMPDETISAWAHRTKRVKTERLINWLARNPNHCAEAYESEKTEAQNDQEYRDQ